MVRPTPCVMIDLDRPRQLRLTFGAMKAFEDATGRSLLLPGNWTAVLHEEVWALLWACLLPEAPALTMDEVGEWVGPAEVQYIMERLDVAFRVAAPDPAEPDDDEENEGQSGDVPDWLTLWTIGCADLGMTDAEFWACTPREVSALVARRRKLEDAAAENDDYRAALVASTVFNMQRGQGTPAASAKDFMPERTRKRKRPQTDEQMLQMIRSLNAAFGGEVIEA